MESRILIGDCRATLAELPAGSVHCCVTSPPYFALRSYLPKDHPDKALEIGSEATIDAFIATMLDVFDAVRRVLRDDGTLWVNIGDSYNASPGQRKETDEIGPKQATNKGSNTIGSRSVPGLKPGDQCLVPYRFALAMQAQGWYLRSTIIWRKLSPMPESIAGVRWVPCRVKVASGRGAGDGHPSKHEGGLTRTVHGEHAGGGNAYRDFTATWQPCPGCPKCLPNNGYVLRRGRWRPTQAHEPIFLFSKSERYFCDGDAVAEAVADPTRSGSGNKAKRWGQNHTTDRKSGTGEIERHSSIPWEGSETRNPRSVMTFPAEPYKAAHFATYPSSLPAFAIRAGTSSAGCCPACGACYAPVVESERVPTRPGEANQIDASGMANRDPQRHVAVNRVTGYRATCSCNAGPAVPCVVLDPFLGSGTTAQAAVALGRDWRGCELNEEYAELAKVRINTPPKWATTKPKRKPRIVFSPQQLSLLTDTQ